MVYPSYSRSKSHFHCGGPSFLSCSKCVPTCYNFQRFALTLWENNKFSSYFEPFPASTVASVLLPEERSWQDAAPHHIFFSNKANWSDLSTLATSSGVCQLSFLSFPWFWGHAIEQTCEAIPLKQILTKERISHSKVIILLRLQWFCI